MNPRNIYEQQAANRRNTLFVMAGFALLVGLIGLGFDATILGIVPGDSESFLGGLPVVTLGALLYGSFAAVSSLVSGAKTVLGSAGAVPIDETNESFRQYVNVADEMAIAAGVPRPALYVIPDPDPNAFATGTEPSNASIAVTQGLLSQLTREELQAVVAHEMSHIRNFDIRLMTIVAALIGTVMLLTELGLRAMRAGALKGKGGSKKSGGGGPIVLVVFAIAIVLAPVLSRLLAMAVSRQREYLADASAAELTRNPAALASALTKIDMATDPTRSIKKGTAHLCIADPLAREVNDREGFLADLFATHPPIRRRIMILSAMAYQGGVTSPGRPPESSAGQPQRTPAETP
ncbi:MAG: Zn-dependent protease with chaperone function [Bacteroidetes bacterium]|nr:Zn-dependent protease with chaperone function [Bacteroidota bacterium]